MPQKFSWIKRSNLINEWTIILIVSAMLFVVLIISSRFQDNAEKNAFVMPRFNSKDSNSVKDGRDSLEMYKLAAEVRQIRSDTSGSLFWLKMVALFITVGGAVGGYLTAQNTITKNKINFELRKNIDEAYQKIVQDLSSPESILRAASAVKLGGILQNFPREWVSSENETYSGKRKEELTLLTKQVLAAALALEKDEKVLKTITIALAREPEGEAVAGKKKKILAAQNVLHEIGPDQACQHIENKSDPKKINLRKLDLSWANANDAYWANVDFSGADFFKANLSKTSFKGAYLMRTSFYYANLTSAVLKGATCISGYFNFANLCEAKLNAADLRWADFTDAQFDKRTDFTGAKVFGMTINPDNIQEITDTLVDTSADGNSSEKTMESLKAWLNKR